jgi:DNA-binding XRE family transcriptional regulator
MLFQNFNVLLDESIKVSLSIAKIFTTELTDILWLQVQLQLCKLQVGYPSLSLINLNEYLEHEGHVEVACIETRMVETEVVRLCITKSLLDYLIITICS